MAKTIEFNIKLIDSVTGVAKTVTTSLGGVNTVVDEIVQTVRQSESSLKTFATRMFSINQLSSAFSGVYSALDSVTAGSRSFETGMAKVNTMAEKGQKELKGLTAQVRQIAKDVPIARDMLTEGLYQTISNGVPENNWIDFLNKSSRTSVGGIANLGKVVTVTSTIIKNYALEWDKAGLIQDKIQKTAKLGVTSFEQMSEALPRVAGNAATLGVNIDDLLGTFATLTGVSGNTAEVSTQLAAVFTALVKPTTEAEKTAKKMGITFNALSVKKAGGLIPFVQQLDAQVNKYVKKTGDLKENVYASLFGSSESLRAIIPLIGPLASDFESKTEQIRKSAGTIDAAFANMDSTTDSRIQKIKNRFENFGDKILSVTSKYIPFMDASVRTGQIILQLAPLYEVYTRLMSAAGIAINTLTARINIHAISLQVSQKWTKICAGAQTVATVVTRLWNKATDRAIINGLTRMPLALTATTVGMKLYTAVAVPATLATWGVTGAIKALSRAIYAIPVVGWILAIIAAIIALGVAIYKGFKYLWDNSEKFREILFGIWEVVKYVFSAIWEVIKKVAVAIWDSYVTVWKAIGSFFISLWEGIKAFFSWVWEGVVGMLTSVWNSVTGFFVGIWNSLTKVFTPIRNWITNNIVQPLKNAFSGVWDFIKGMLDKVMNKLDGMLAPIRALWNKLFGGTAGAWDEGTAKGRASYRADVAKRKNAQGIVPDVSGIQVSDIQVEGKKGIKGIGNGGSIVNGQIDATTAAGAGRTINNYITVGSLVESLSIQAASLKEGISDMKAEVIKAMLEVLNSQNMAVGY